MTHINIRALCSICGEHMIVANGINDAEHGSGILIEVLPHMCTVSCNHCGDPVKSVNVQCECQGGVR